MEDKNIISYLTTVEQIHQQSLEQTQEAIRLCEYWRDRALAGEKRLEEIMQLWYNSFKPSIN